MNDVDAEYPDAHRLALFRSVFEPAPLHAVAEAVAVASEQERRLYVERIGDGYRWSLTHPGGGYPLLRLTARFLRVDYPRITVGFRTVAAGVYVLSADPQSPAVPAEWTLLNFDRPTSPEGARESILFALS